MTRPPRARPSYGPIFSTEKDSALMREGLLRFVDKSRNDPKKLAVLSKLLKHKSRLYRVLGHALGSASARSAPRIFKRLKADGPAMLQDQRAMLASFEKRLYGTWRRPIDLLEMLIRVCAETGESLSAQWPWKESPDRSLVFDVVRQLQARACQVASEVLTLLKAGYAPAAHARWRTVHELAATAAFIAEHGKDAAERFLLHEHVEAWRAAQQYQRYRRRLGQRRFSRKEMATFRRNYTRLLKQYGTEFRTPYGWAAAALASKNPTFADIEKAAKLDHLRPYYKMASYPVHATTKSIRFSLALMPGQRLLLTGPSDLGLTDPGHCTAISLGQITTTLVALWPSSDTVSLIKVLLLFTDEIGDEFIKAQRQMKARIKKRRSRRRA